MRARLSNVHISVFALKRLQRRTACASRCAARALRRMPEGHACGQTPPKPLPVCYGPWLGAVAPSADGALSGRMHEPCVAAITSHAQAGPLKKARRSHPSTSPAGVSVPSCLARPGAAPGGTLGPRARHAAGPAELSVLLGPSRASLWRRRVLARPLGSAYSGFWQQLRKCTACGCNAFPLRDGQMKLTVLAPLYKSRVQTPDTCGATG